MFRISELAELAGVNPPTIRYYEQIGVLAPPKRTGNGYRYYDETDEGRLRFIIRARELDFSLQEIGEIVSFREKGDAPCAYVIDKINKKIRTVDRKISMLTSLKSELKQLRDKANNLPLAEIRAKGSVCHILENQELKKKN